MTAGICSQSCLLVRLSALGGLATLTLLVTLQSLCALSRQCAVLLFLRLCLEIARVPSALRRSQPCPFARSLWDLAWPVACFFCLLVSIQRANCAPYDALGMAGAIVGVAGLAFAARSLWLIRCAPRDVITRGPFAVCLRPLRAGCELWLLGAVLSAPPFLRGVALLLPLVFVGAGRCSLTRREEKLRRRHGARAIARRVPCCRAPAWAKSGAAAH
jgi:hypothetical protein